MLVKFRTADQAFSVPFTEVPFTRTCGDDLIETIGWHGGILADDGHQYAKDELTTQLEVDQDGVCLVIVAGEA